MFPPMPRLSLPRLCPTVSGFGASKALDRHWPISNSRSATDRATARAEKFDHLEMPVNGNDNESDESRYGQASKNDLAVRVEIVEKALHVYPLGRRV